VKALIVTLTLATTTSIAFAQHGQHGQHESPYRAHQAAGSSLSAKELADLEAGNGMGLARAAELNGYPGPRHVLDAANDGKLTLTADQREAVEEVFASMQRDAQAIGKHLIAEERALDGVFRSGRISEAEVGERVKKLATMQGHLREVHLRAHLATKALLTDAQIARYNELRGYSTQR
jgi:hypothetical protein